MVKSLRKYVPIALLVASLGLGFGCTPKKDKFKIEYSLMSANLFESDAVEVEIGEWKHYNGDVEIGYRLMPVFNRNLEIEDYRWNKVEIGYYMRYRNSLPIVYHKSDSSEIPYEDVPGSPKGATSIIVDFDQGEEYARGEFGGKRSSEFLEESLKNAKEWAERMKKYFESRYEKNEDGN